LARKNPVTTRVRVAVSACAETDVLSRVLKMLAQKKSTNATNETMIALLGEKEGPRGGWNECLPSTPATTTSETTNKRTAWLRAPTSERKVKATIFRRRWLRASIRMTERRETFGAFPETFGAFP